MKQKKFFNFSDNSKENEILEQTEITTEIKNKIEESEEVISEPVITEETISCFVTNCERLNVRKKPNKNSEILCVVDQNTELVVCVNYSDSEDFYKVYTPAGIEGYVMKNYISIR